MRWAGHVALMWDRRGAYRVLVGKTKGKRPLRRPSRRCWDSIRMGEEFTLKGLEVQLYASFNLGHAPTALPPGKTQCPLYRAGLGGCGKLPPPNRDLILGPVQPVASCFTDWSLPAHLLKGAPQSDWAFRDKCPAVVNLIMKRQGFHKMRFFY